MALPTYARLCEVSGAENNVALVALCAGMGSDGLTGIADCMSGVCGFYGVWSGWWVSGWVGFLEHKLRKGSFAALRSCKMSCPTGPQSLNPEP